MADLPTENQALTKSGGLTARQENFARMYAETGVALEAYQAAYDCAGSSRATVRVNAHRLLHNPRVASRVRALQDAAGAVSLRSTQALVADLEAAVDADPNELVTLLNGACRHCWGEHGCYQWRDADEYVTAVEAAGSKGQCAPACDGGFGYTFHRDPNPDCTSCDGVGLNRIKFNNTQDVSPGARRLIRGFETYPDGSVRRLHLHDQAALRAELHKLRGLHVDRSLNVNVNANVPPLKDLTHEQMLDFLESLKPTA